jgi:hypothetical protein
MIIAHWRNHSQIQSKIVEIEAKIHTANTHVHARSLSSLENDFSIMFLSFMSIREIKKKRKIKTLQCDVQALN